MEGSRNFEHNYTKKDLKKFIENSLEEGDNYISFVFNINEIPKRVSLEENDIVFSGTSKMVDVLETIKKNNLPLPAFELIDEIFSAELQKNEEDMDPFMSTGEHLHMHASFGKIGEIEGNDSAYIVVPYYIYEWSNFGDVDGAQNFPIIDAGNILVDPKKRFEEE